MKICELEEFLRNVKDKNKDVYFYYAGDNPFDCCSGVENAFETSKDAASTGNFEGVYLKGN